VGNDDTLAVARLEQNLWSMFRVFGVGPGARLTDTPTRMILETPIARAPYNSVFRFFDEGDRPLGTQLDEVLARFVGRNCTPAWLIHPTAPPEIRSLLAERGWVCAEEIPGMVRELADDASPGEPPVGVEIVEASGDAPGDWLDLVSSRYGLAPTDSSFLSDVFRHAVGSSVRVFIARIDGTPVSKVGMHVHDGVVGFYGVVTAEAGRGRGLASHLMRIAMAAARESGVATCVLHSTPVAHGLYMGLGFRDVATFELWAEPDRVHL